MLVDESTGSLDRKNGNIVMNILHQLNAEGKKIIMVTHDDTPIYSRDMKIVLQ